MKKTTGRAFVCLTILACCPGCGVSVHEGARGAGSSSPTVRVSRVVIRDAGVVQTQVIDVDRQQLKASLGVSQAGPRDSVSSALVELSGFQACPLGSPDYYTMFWDTTDCWDSASYSLCVKYAGVTDSHWASLSDFTYGGTIPNASTWDGITYGLSKSFGQNGSLVDDRNLPSVSLNWMHGSWPVTCIDLSAADPSTLPAAFHDLYLSP